MGNATRDIGENDLVVRRERVGDGPVGTIGTAVSIYDDAVLVEVSENAVGRSTRSSSPPISSK